MNGPDPALVRQKLMKWDGYLRDFSLPAWEELPQLELYMDQVVSLINSYLAYLPKEEGTNLVVTKAAVNNYVRKRIMPPPVKKRYGRVHLAYLILICDLKQCFSIADVQRLLPPDLEETQVRRIYDRYVLRHRETALLFVRTVRERTGDFFAEAPAGEQEVEDLLISSAVAAGLSKLLTEKLLGLPCRKSE